MRHGRTALLAAALFALLPLRAEAFSPVALKSARGEEIWFAEDHTLPLVALVASFPAGSAYDPDGKDGLASFAAAMLDEGAGRMDSASFHAALADKAIRLSVDVTRDDTVVSLMTLSANLKEAMRLLALALAHPRFDGDAIARVRAQMIQSLKLEDEDPSEVASRAFDRYFYGAHPYAHAVDGDYAGLAAITRDDLASFAAGHWVRGGLKVAVTGDADAATLATLVRSTFGMLSSAMPEPPPRPARLGAPGLHLVDMDVPQPNAVFGLPGITRGDPDFIAAYVANYILGGGGFSSRLMDEVREKRGLTYDISTDLTAFHRAGAIEGQVATRANAMRQTIQVVRDTMSKFAQDGPTPRELADAKTYLTGSFPLAFSSNADAAAQMNTFQREGLPISYISRRNDLIRSVTPDDVRRVAKRLFDPKRLTIVVAGTMKDTKPWRHRVP